MYTKYRNSVQENLNGEQFEMAKESLSSAAYWLFALQDSVEAEQSNYDTGDIRQMQIELAELYEDIAILHHLRGEYGDAYVAASEGIDIWPYNNALQTQKERSLDAMIDNVLSKVNAH